LLAALLIVVGALWMDLHKEPTELRPFAIGPIEAGSPIDPALVEYRPVPEGILPDVALDGIATTLIDAGEPVLPSALGDRQPLPDGWWALEMTIPTGTTAGSELRLIANDGSTSIAIPALVMAVGRSDPPSGWSDDSALVAVPEDQALLVAAALELDQLTVLLAGW
jgi:hypothetical protein